MAANREELITCAFRCPACTAAFQADEIHGAVPVRRETDFRPVYAGRDPVIVNIHSCPGCRYSAYAPGFVMDRSAEDELGDPHEAHALSLPAAPVAIPDDDEVAGLRRYLRSGELTAHILKPTQEPFGATRYMLAARIRDFLYEEPATFHAHYYLRAAWAARATKERDVERRALYEVAARLRPELETARPPHRMRLSYLVGEVSRRLGDFAQAVDLLSTVEHGVDIEDPEGAFLGALAQRQSVLAFMKSDVNAVIPNQLPGWWRRRPAGEDDVDDGGETLN